MGLNYQWPDLYFGPINLWTAPWLGRRYEEYNRCSMQTAYAGNPKLNAHIEQIRTLTKNR